MIDKINPGAWNNFFKSLLRLYLWRPIAENFLNNKEDYLYFTEKLYPFTKDKCKMMLITRKKPAKRRKKMVKKRTTSIPSPETSYIPPKIEKTIYTPPSRHAYFGVENHLRMDLAGKGEIPLPL